MIITQEIVERLDTVVARGFCAGVGSRDGQMCVEAAICYALGEPHGDNPSCVEPAVRDYKIVLNDSSLWGDPKARASGMRALAIAQLGSEGVVSGAEFVKRLRVRTIRVLIPRLFREVLADYPHCLAAADRCELEGTSDAAYAAYLAAVSAANTAVVDTVIYAANAAAAAAVATHAANAAAVDAVIYAANAAAAAATHAANAADGQKYLELSAGLALEVLRELGSPGVAWLDQEAI